MNTKLKIKLGHIEIECEGTEEFVKAELPTLVKNFSDLSTLVPALAAVPATPNGHPVNGTLTGFQSTTENLAAKLGTKSEPELVLAAAARLTLAVGKDTFSRKELLEEMKTATTFFTTGHRKHMSQSISNLLKNDKLNEISSDKYALSAGAKNEIIGKIRG